MKTLLNEYYAPITSTFGFLELPFDQCLAALREWNESLYTSVTVRQPKRAFPGSLKELQPLVYGSRPRQLLVSAGSWTAYFDSLARGTDPAAFVGHLSQQKLCQGLIVAACAPSKGDPGGRPIRNGVVGFTLYGPLKTDWLNEVRSVSVTDNYGKAAFQAVGLEQWFEEPSAHQARRVRDRFTPELLERYCQALGIDLFNPDFYGPESALIESSMVPRPGRADPVVGKGARVVVESASLREVSLVEAQTEQGIVPGEALSVRW
ncbi:MAG TPA: hypothetical protein VGM94_13865 [Galbitalea sp.]|jgi:hypothetical protein